MRRRGQCTGAPPVGRGRSAQGPAAHRNDRPVEGAIRRRQGRSRVDAQAPGASRPVPDGTAARPAQSTGVPAGGVPPSEAQGRAAASGGNRDREVPRPVRALRAPGRRPARGPHVRELLRRAPPRPHLRPHLRRRPRARRLQRGLRPARALPRRPRRQRPHGTVRAGVHVAGPRRRPRRAVALRADRPDPRDRRHGRHQHR